MAPDVLEPRFACDAMLGGLARWLRAAGYDAAWIRDIPDWDLVRLAAREGRILVSCDTGIFRIGVVRDGEIGSLRVPTGLSTAEQLAFVAARLRLGLRAPRCMACGGALHGILREEARGRVPPRTFEWRERFAECDRCGRLFWEGTHWQRIERHLRRVWPPATAEPEFNRD